MKRIKVVIYGSPFVSAFEHFAVLIEFYGREE
jgi:hypothetical protein